MSMQNLKDNVDRGTHHEAQAKQKESMNAYFAKHIAPCVAGNKKQLHATAQKMRGADDEPITAARFLTAQAEAEGVGPTDVELKACEDYWLRRLKVRPHEMIRTEKVREYARNRWTVDAMFHDAGISMRGPQQSTVQKAFTTSTTQVIFPFYYSAAIEAGILASPILDRIIMEDIPVNSHTADHATMTDNVGDRSTAVSSEGASGTEVIIRASNQPIKLLKFKSKALATYESLRLQRLPIFERGLMRVGQQFMIQITDFGMNTLVAGDGNAVGGGAAGTVATGTNGTPVYADVVALEMAFTMGYEMEDGVLIAPYQSLTKLLNMAEFKDPLAGGRYQFHGEMPTPVGHELLRWDSTGNVSGWSTAQVMNCKSGLSMIKYTEGGLLVETDRIIDSQWDMSVASTWTGFGIWDRNATKVSTGW